VKGNKQEIRTWDEIEASGDFESYRDMGLFFAKVHVIRAVREIVGAQYDRLSGKDLTEKVNETIKEFELLKKIK
jgi:hypothetical protein